MRAHPTRRVRPSSRSRRHVLQPGTCLTRIRPPLGGRALPHPSPPGAPEASREAREVGFPEGEGVAVVARWLLIALITALSDADEMLLSIPTPQRTAL